MRIPSRPVILLPVIALLASVAVAADQAPAARSAGAAPPAAAPHPEAPPPNMTVVYLVLLRKGPAWTADATPELEALQAAHLANIRALWKDKKMIVAGPLGDNGEIRGIFVFQAGSIEEAREIAATDPAIKAGRLTAEIHPWWVEKTALPPAGSACTPPPGAPAPNGGD